MAIRELAGLPPLPAKAPANMATAGLARPSAAPPSPPIDRAQLAEAVDRANRLIAGAARNLSFRIDQETGKPIAQVIDTETGGVVRQIPSEEMLAISRALDRMQGLMIHLKV